MPQSASDSGTNGHSTPISSKQTTAFQIPSIRRTLGIHEASSLAGPLLVKNLEQLEHQNPAMGRHLIEAGFGTNSNLTIERRETAMLIVAMLIAIGDTTDQIQVYLRAAMMHGATENEILDLINQTTGFVGAPRAVNGMRAMHKLLDEARGYALPTETIVSLSDHATLVRDTGGEGPPVILIHALSMDSRMWKDVSPKLASVARVITYDMRGHGQARAAPLTQSLYHLAKDLLELMEILGIEKADVYGASYGGGVAQHFGLNYPKRVRSLALIATTSEGHPFLRTRATRAEENGIESLVPESLIRWFLPETIASNGWMVRYARSCVRKARVEDWAAAWRAMADLNCIKRISELEVPVLVLAGVQDASTPPSMMKPTFEACKYGEYRELNPGTHMMAMEQAEEVAKEFVAFRQRVDAKHK